MPQAGGNPRGQFLEHHAGDGRHVELGRVRDRHPDQFDQLGIGADDAVDAVGDLGRVGGEEARVEAPRPPRRGDGAGDEMDAREIGKDAGSGKFGPDVAGHHRRRFALDAEQEPGFLAGLAHRRERKAAGVAGARIGDAQQELALRFGVQFARRRHGASSASMRPPGKTNLPGMNL